MCESSAKRRTIEFTQFRAAPYCRYETRFETVWRRVSLQGLGWQAHHAPEDPGMQLYASWNYPRWVGSRTQRLTAQKIPHHM
jgi:hypothetical protein